MTEDFENDFILPLSDSKEELKSERKYISKLFLRFTLAALIAYAATFGLAVLSASVAPTLYANSFVQLLINDLYVVNTIWLFAVFTRRMPAVKPAQTGFMTFSSFVRILCISIFLMFSGALIGNGISAIAGVFLNRELANSVEDIMYEYPLWQIAIFTVVVAPVAEELLFRKLLLGKLSRYGTGFAIAVSGIVFGVFHYNFYQFFYGAFLGLLLGFVYSVYGELRYTILLHAIINFLGSVVAMGIQSLTESGSAQGYMISALYGYAYLAVVVTGAVFLYKLIRDRKLYYVEGVLVSPRKTLWKSLGFAVYVVYSLIMFVISLYI